GPRAAAGPLPPAPPAICPSPTRRPRRACDCDEGRAKVHARHARGRRRPARPPTDRRCAGSVYRSCAYTPGQTRVERVVEAVADQVEREHGGDDRDPGEQAEPPCVTDGRAALPDHVAPAHQVLIAEAEEADPGLEQDGV